MAIHYRTPEEARRRAERWREERGAEEARALTRTANRIPRIDELRDLLGRVLGSPGEPQRNNPGGLALLDPRSGAVRRLEAAGPGAIPQDWSGDRKRLLYRARDGSRFQLWELAMESGEVRPLTRGRHSHPEGCYAAGGRLVVTVLEHSREGFRSWLALSAGGGGGPYRALSQGPSDHSPRCAPDGRAVVWVAEARRGQPELRYRRLGEDDSPLRLAAGVDPTFSPDGLWIVFSARTGKRWGLWRMRSDGSARAPLGPMDLDALSPSVSPDGRFVIYVASEAVPRRQLWLRTFRGGSQRLLPVPGEADSPRW